MKLQFENARRDLYGIFNEEWSEVYSTPGLRSAGVAARCGEVLPCFAERVLLFSQKQHEL